MSTEADARRARLGEDACRRAREVGDTAREFTPEQRTTLAVLLRDSTTKATRKAA